MALLGKCQGLDQKKEGNKYDQVLTKNLFEKRHFGERDFTATIVITAKNKSSKSFECSFWR